MSELAEAIERVRRDLAAVGSDGTRVSTSAIALRTVLVELAEALGVAARRGAAIERARATAAEALDCCPECAATARGFLAALGGEPPHERP